MTPHRAHRRPAKRWTTLALSTLASSALATATLVGGQVGTAGVADAAAITGTLSTNSISYATPDGDILSLRQFIQPGTGRDLIAMGGNFTRIRTADGTYHAAVNLAIMDAQTGAFVKGINTNSTGYVRTIRVNPAGTVLYVGGSFTSVAGASRARIAALNTSSWGVTTFNPGSPTTVYALEASASMVYSVGNSSSAIAYNATNGAKVWSDSANCGTKSLLLSNDRKSLYVGGLFDTIKGFAQHGLVKVSATTGAVDTGFKVDYLKKDSGGCVSGHPGYDGENPISMVMDNVSGHLIVGAGGIMNGFRAVNPTTGSFYWTDAPAGDGQAVAAVGNTDVIGHHQSGVHLKTGWTAGPNFIGQVKNDGSNITSWDPKLAGYQSNVDHGNNGTQAMVFDPVSNRLFVGGGFLTQNGLARKGLAVFTVS